MARSFYQAHKLMQKRKDEEAWWQGLYIQKALMSTVGNLFLEEGTEPNRYPQEPFLQEQDKELAEKRRAKEEEHERIRLVAYLNQVMMTRKQQGR